MAFIFLFLNETDEGLTTGPFELYTNFPTLYGLSPDAFCLLLLRFYKRLIKFKNYEWLTGELCTDILEHRERLFLVSFLVASRDTLKIEGVIETHNGARICLKPPLLHDLLNCSINIDLRFL